MVKTLRNSFISGLFLIAPLGVTIFVIQFLVNNIGDPISKYIFSSVDPATLESQKFLFNTLSTVIAVLLITLLGLFSNYLFGRLLIRIFERIMSRLPFINTIYRTVKQIVDTFSTQNRSVFQTPVMIEFPQQGTYSIGFLTNEARGETAAKAPGALINVFIPTTPNPTSGFLILTPRDKIIELEMSVGDAMKLLISGGAVAPAYNADTQTNVSHDQSRAHS
jgi:uncharacterized membrane protein